MINFNDLPAKDKIYYQDESAAIYCCDNRDVLPLFPDKAFDLVLTDPPYPDDHLEYGDFDSSILTNFDCKQIVFWSKEIKFPISYSAIHIWDKVVCCGSGYERIFERNGNRNYKVYRFNAVNSPVSAQFASDVWTAHPSQKPRKLIESLITEYSNITDLILDPFLGSGTTAVAAKILGRKCIGIEISEKYCEIAAKRLSQSVMQLEIPKEDVKTETML